MGFIFGTIKYVIRSLLKLSILFAIFIAFVLLVPNLPPYTSFTAIELEPTQPRVGPLAPNDALNNAQQLYKGRLSGPEAFQIHNGELYTTVHTGEVLKLSPNGHVTFVTKIGRPCTDHSQEHICGRPLGFDIDDTNRMYLVDAYHGIWRVDLDTDKKQLLVSPRVEIEGKLPMIINDLALSRTKRGDFYYTVSSSDFLLRDGGFTALADPSGRLVYYDSSKNSSRVLLDNLYLANGVVVSPDNQYVVVAESFRYRLIKYYIDGPNKGKSEVFVAGLPGVPDNIRALPDGSGVLIALYTSFDADYPLITRSLASAPLARKFLARVQRLMEIPFEFLNAQFPNPVFEDIVYKIGHFKSMAGLSPGTSGLVQTDWDGNIVASYFNTDGSLKGVSDAVVYGDKLMTGMPNFHDFVGAVPAPPALKKAFQKVQRPVEQKQKPVEQKQKLVEQKQKPVEQKQKLVEQKQKIVEQKQKPVEQKQKPVEQKQKPVEQNQRPVEQKEAPKVTKPVETRKPTQKPTETTTPKPAVKETKPVPTTPPPKQTEKTTQKPPTTKPVQPEKVQAKKPEKVEPKKTEKVEPPKKAQTVEPKRTGKVEVENPDIIVVREPKEREAGVKIIREPKNPTKEIPVREDIPSDTKKPTNDKMKVIKKTGPAELPVK